MVVMGTTLSAIATVGVVPQEISAKPFLTSG